MDMIRILDNSLVNKIAAGEVVERPSSVVKELVENSIDACASAITVEIKNGGINLIKVIDNGKGIPKEQIHTAFLRHATSKIEVFDDLEQVLTLGFRGEALSSICAVSQVEMITKTKEEKIGVKIEVHGGNVTSEEDIACNDGTMFTMKNLFFNTPARRKFLKKPVAESSAISDIMNKMALGHPEISFKYINNNSTIIHTSGNSDIRTAVFYVYGKDISKKMIDIDYEKNGYHIKGLIAKPEINKSNRTYENFFINGRFIKSNIVQNAIEDAYKGKLMVGKFPVFVINMEVPKNTVDVNVHPAKLEVRFSDDDFVYHMIFEAVEACLNNENLIPSVSWDKPSFSEITNTKPYIADKEQINIINYIDDKVEYNTKYNFNEDFLNNTGISVNETCEESLNTNKFRIKKKISDDFKNKFTVKYDDTQDNEKIEAIELELLCDDIQNNEKIIDVGLELLKEEKIESKNPFFHNYKIVGQIFDTYWIIEQNNSMYMIDQHAAHERFLYEKFIKKFKSLEPMSQRMLQAIAINLSEKEKQIVSENLDLLEGFGFEIEEFGINTYALRAVPFIFNAPVKPDFFIDIINMLDDKNINNIYDVKLDVIATMSCKAAVKGNNRLSYTEARELIENIIKIENPFTCPHGRPTIIEMPKHEVEKKFKRI